MNRTEEKLTSREEALKRIISQEEYDRVMESNRQWESDEIERHYRRMYAKAFYDSFPSNGTGGSNRTTTTNLEVEGDMS